MDITQEILNYLTTEFAIEQDADFDNDVNLFDYGYIDSLDATKIIMFLEKHFKIEITQRDLMLYPMNSVNEIAEVIQNKLKGE